MKAIKIDPFKRRVEEIEVSDDTLATSIGCSLFAIGARIKAGRFKEDTLYVDDEGMITPNKPVFKFKDRDGEQTLAGNGVLLGADIRTGESEDVGSSLFDVAIAVEWTDLVTR